MCFMSRTDSEGGGGAGGGGWGGGTAPPSALCFIACSCVFLKESRFRGICACPAASPGSLRRPSSLFISAGILIRALRAPAGEVRGKLCFLTANKNLIISLIQVAHFEKGKKKKKGLTSAITQSRPLPFSLMPFFI